MSPPTLIKICGIKDSDMLSQAIKAGADYVGFNHFPKSPRYVDVYQIAELIKSTPKNIKSVVLLVDPDAKTLASIMALKPDFVQFHGNETAAWINNALGDTDQPTIKVLPIGSKSDLEAIHPFIGLVEHILLDAKPPKSATRPGGLGETFDWSLLKDVDKNLRFFLAGGLNPDNVAKAIAQVNPFGVDVASGVESTPGIKDAALITKFVVNAKQADKDRDRT
ncbi:MAG: phosphoribosylanthranilate isomerase [Devosiaceae bacterium]|nr:phosphoribosylanthranilate isomerase [Devosiaceae bacterium]